MTVHKVALLCMGLTSILGCLTTYAAPPVPATPREYRAAWCATVSNIDWPPVRGTSNSTANTQKARLIAHLNALQAARMNAMYLQVRPECDALYVSGIEPSSYYVTGSQGAALNYDPLAFAVEEAHKRGIELHAWINPYRASQNHSTSGKAATHVTRSKSYLCVKHTDGRTYMNPAKQGTIDHIKSVVQDIVTRYDVDGVVMDDYFYPGTTFDDAADYTAYVNGGGSMNKDNWRRDNVDRMIQTCYTTIHGVRQSCQFSVGPFGIWRPGYPAGVSGSDYYATHYCDTRKWLQMGWVDSLSPQLYWPSDSPGQPFGALINWWVQQNTNRHVLASTAPYRVGDSAYDSYGNIWSNKTASEIVTQVNLTKSAGGVGNVHYSQKWLTDNLNNQGILAALTAPTGPYAKDALRPASTWLDNVPPPAPSVSMGPLTGSPARKTITFSQAPTDEKAVWWCVNTWDGSSWTLKVLPGRATSYDAPANTVEVAVSAVDRCGNESARSQTTAVGNWEDYGIDF